MAAVDYKVLQQSIDFAKKLSRVLDNELVETTLRDTAGKDTDDEVVYRPYWTAAVLLDSKLQQLVKAEGAEFRDLQYNVNALKERQWALDESLSLIVPIGTQRVSVSSRARTKTVRRRLVL